MQYFGMIVRTCNVVIWMYAATDQGFIQDFVLGVSMVENMLRIYVLRMAIEGPELTTVTFDEWTY